MPTDRIVTMETCRCCGHKFQFGQGIYDGRMIGSYLVCDRCPPPRSWGQAEEDLFFERLDRRIKNEKSGEPKPAAANIHV